MIETTAMTRNMETALSLALAGMAVFPCHAGGEHAKRPMPFIKWREASTTDVGKIRQWWMKWPNAAIGLDLAKCGLLVIDCDRHSDDDGVEAFGRLAAEYHHNIDVSPLVATPKEGTHVYFRQPEERELGNARGILPAGIDVRGAGGYVIAPGTVMEDGRVYELFGSLSAVPGLPEWLTSILGSATAAPVAERVPVQRQKHSDTRVEAYCDAAITAELFRVETAPQGARNNTLNQAAFALGQLVGAGWKSETEITALLANAAAVSGLAAVESRKTIQSGLRAGRQEPRILDDSEFLEVDQQEASRIAAQILAAFEKRQREQDGTRQVIQLADGGLADAETGEVISIRQLTRQNETIIEYPPGLVGDIARWMVATSIKPQPSLAIGAALTIVGAASGRQFTTPVRKGSTVLYVLGLAPTSQGKEIQLDHIRRIFKMAGLGQHLGPEEFMSHSSIINKLKRMALCLTPMDEFGDFLHRIYSKNSNPHARAIPKILRSVWGKNYGIYSSPEWAEKESVEIIAPHLSIFTGSTHEQFYSALESSAVSDGTLNRFLIIEGQKRPARQQIAVDPFTVPEKIINGIKQIYGYSGDLAMAYRNDPSVDPVERGLAVELKWCPDGAEQAYLNFCTEIENRMFSHPEQSDFLGRTAEMAVRIASIVAIGRLEDKQVRITDMQYGIELARQSAEMMISGAESYMAENETEANWKKIIRIIQNAKDGRVPYRKIQNNMRTMTTRQLKEMLAGMCEASAICKHEVVRPDGGHPVVWYSILGENHE